MSKKVDYKKRIINLMVSILASSVVLSACNSNQKNQSSIDDSKGSSEKVIDQSEESSESNTDSSSEMMKTTRKVELKEVNEAMIAEYNKAADAAQEALWNEFWDENRGYLRREYPHRDDDIGKDYWWFAHAIDTFIDGYERTKDDKYLERAKKVAHGVYERNGNSFINDYFDDMDWMGLALLRFYDNTKEDFYLEQSKILFGQVSDSWSGIAGGGVAWNRTSLNFKNTPANAPAVILAARLYERTDDKSYSDWAHKIFDWMHEHLRDPESGYIIDGLRDANELQVVENAYTYNHGTYIGAACEMFKLTNDNKYLEYADLTLENARKTYSNNSANVIEEKGEGDGGLFKGILMRYVNLYYFINPEKSDSAKEWITANADSVMDRAINEVGLIADRWRGPSKNKQELSTHLSGVMLLEACSKQYNK